MDFAFSPEQDMLRAAARDYLADRYPTERVANLADGADGWDPQSWSQLAELGWLDPDLGPLEHAVLAEETGRRLYPGPLFSTLGLSWPLLTDGLRGAVASGERSFTLAWAEDAAAVMRADQPIGCRAARDGEGWRLTGDKRFVTDLAIVSDVLVTAVGEDGFGIFGVELAAARPEVVTRSTVDRTRRLADLHLDSTPARRLEATDQSLDAVRRRALAWLSCEAVGVANTCLELSVEHAKTRQTFGRPIGSYQAVSHAVAEVYSYLELARSLAYWAAWSVETDDVQAEGATAAAKASAGEAAVRAAENAIQVHGGIGFTWDHPLHRYYKRALAIEAFAGGTSAHRATIAELLLA